MKWLILLAFFLLPSFAHAATLSRPANNLGLVGYWNFNEATGTVVHDFSGQGNYGTTSNSISWATGKMGGGVSFDGTLGYVSIPDSNDFNVGTSPITIAGWVKFNSGGLGIYQPLISQNLDSFELVKSSANKLRMEMKYNDGTSKRAEEITASLTSANTWYHVAGIFYPATGAFELYVNGGSKAVSYVDVQAGGTLKNSSEYISIGRRFNGGLQMNGALDEMRVYNRALTASEIKTLYQGGASRAGGTNTLGIKGYWNFNEGRGTTAANFIDGAPSATLFGSPSWVAGKQGNAPSFNGSSQYAEVPLTVTYPKITVSAWFKASSIASGNPRIVANGHTDSDAKGFQLMFNGGGASGFFDVGNGSTEGKAQWSQQLVTGAWYHYVGVYDGANVVAYLNGAQVATAPYAGGPISASGFPVSIGRNNSADYTGDYFNGTIDDVRIYNRALSLAEVRSLYNETIPIGRVQINTNTVGGSLNQGLVGFWSFNNLDVTDKVYDRAGGNNAYVYNSSTSTAKTQGKVGQALNFSNASNIYVDAGNTGNPGISDWTVTAWIKTGVNPAANPQIVSTRDANVSSSAGYQVFLNSSNAITFTFSDGSASRIRINSSSPVVNDNNWHHIVVTFTRNGNGTIYVDGTAATGGSGSISAQPASVINSSNFLIGAQQNGASKSDWFSGSIDEVRIYNRAITAAEVKQLYNAGK